MKISASARRTALVAAPVLAIAGFALAGGQAAAAGAVLGVLMVVLFFAGGRAPMVLANTTPPGLLFLLIAMGYVLRIVALLAVLLLFRDVTWVDHDAVSFTVVAGALLWSAAKVSDHVTSKQPTLEIPVAPVFTSTGSQP